MMKFCDRGNLRQFKTECLSGSGQKSVTLLLYRVQAWKFAHRLLYLQRIKR